MFIVVDLYCYDCARTHCCVQLSWGKQKAKISQAYHLHYQSVWNFSKRICNYPHSFFYPTWWTVWFCGHVCLCMWCSELYLYPSLPAGVFKLPITQNMLCYKSACMVAFSDLCNIVAMGNCFFILDLFSIPQMYTPRHSHEEFPLLITFTYQFTTLKVDLPWFHLSIFRFLIIFFLNIAMVVVIYIWVLWVVIA